MSWFGALLLGWNEGRVLPSCGIFPIEATDIPAIMLFDSCYAANMVTGRWQPNANIAMVEWARTLLADVEATGQTVHWVHVKGHSADGGKDRRDLLPGVEGRR
jgi:hypothetical protein